MSSVTKWARDVAPGDIILSGEYVYGVIQVIKGEDREVDTISICVQERGDMGRYVLRRYPEDEVTVAVPA